jgi:ferritin-like protein
MKKIPMIILVSISCFILIIGCAGKNKIETQKKLMTMSDRELINHYEMIEMRMIDIGRTREQSIEQKHDIYNGYYPRNGFNLWGHLYIPDNWNELKKEKKLTLIEMRNRHISPP